MGRGRKLTEEAPNTDKPETIIVGLFIELLIPGCAEDFQKKTVCYYLGPLSSLPGIFGTYIQGEIIQTHFVSSEDPETNIIFSMTM